jgi:hypothetical protein
MSFVIRDVPCLSFLFTVRYHQWGWTKSKTLTPLNAVEDMEPQELSLLAGVRNGADTFEDSLTVSYKTKHTLTVWSNNPTLRCLPKVLKCYVHTKNCTQMIIAPLFIIPETWRRTSYLAVDVWINYGISRQRNITQHQKMSYHA